MAQMRPASVLVRNAAFVRELGIMLTASAVLVIAAYVCGSATAAAWCAGGCAVCLGLFAAFSVRRYREIMSLAAEVDEVLHAGRTVDFANCHEGDVAVLRNEIAKMVARLARATEQLADEKTLLADAMADISHQIRTPLTALSLKLAAFERAQNDAARRALARDMETLVDRVSWLVTALLRMAKIDAGALSVDCAPVSVAQVTRRAVQPLEMSFDLHGVELVVDVADERFAGDARWTAEALENIVKNCLEHTPSGGCVRVSAAEDALSTRIVVIDEGCGIAEADLPRIFERFYRGTHSACTSGEPGSSAAPGALAQEGVAAPAHEGFGVGLSLAQALVNAQGGTVRASNTAEGGARFEIAFPKLVV